MLVGKVMVAVTVGQQRMFFGGDVRRGVGQGLHQAQSNHVRGGLGAGHRTADIGNRLLDAAGDQACGVRQGSVPVKSNQVEAAGGGWRSHGVELLRETC